MPRDLRTFLKELGETHPEDFIRIRQPINSKFQTAALHLQLEKRGLFPVLYYEQPTDVEGKVSRFPAVNNVLASRRRCAEAIGTTSDRVAIDYFEKISRRIEPVVVSSGEAPVKEVIEKDNIDLFKFPIPEPHADTSGPSITASYITTVDPDTGIDNTSCQRGEVKDRETLIPFVGGNSHNARNISKWWKQGSEAPFAMWIGHHPAVCIGGQVKYGYPESHWPGIGGLLGEPLRLVPSETWGDLLKVPADAEIVIEGVIDKKTMVAAGQFGDYARYLIPSGPRYPVKVTRITRRADAIFHDIVPGNADHQVAGSFALEANLYSTCKRVAPEVVNVHMPRWGMCRATAYIQVRNPRPGAVRSIISTALVADQNMKTVFVVDDDVDIFNDHEVWWAFTTRCHLDQNLMIMDGLLSSPMNPATRSGGLGAKMGADCTLPPALDPEFPRHYQMAMRVPQEAMDGMNLSDWLPAETLRAVAGAS